MAKFNLTRARALAGFAILGLCSACTTPTVYHKIVTVTKGPNGGVISMNVVEEVTQPQRAERPLPFEHLDE